MASADISPNGISISSFDPEDAVATATTVEGRGIKVGENTVLHPAVGLETGFVSNVFYSSTNPQAAGVLRLLAQLGTGSLDGIRLVSPAEGDANTGKVPEFSYRASVNLSYDQMLSDNSTINATGGLGIGALLRGMTNPSKTWSFGFQDTYSRLIRAANFETDANTNRDINIAGLTVLFHPKWSSISGYAYYTNTIDVFEAGTQQFADRMFNVVGVHPQWKWLPQTSVFADVSIGFDGGIGGGSRKVSSMPFNAQLGISTLLTPKVTAGISGGYANGFYASGPSFSSPTVAVDLGYRYSPLGRIALTYNYLFADSVNANYYRDNVIRLWWQQLAAPFVIMAQPELHFREYSGVCSVIMAVDPACTPGSPADTRDDTIISVVVGAHYIFRNWIAATLDYHFTDVTTNYRYNATAMFPNTDPSFIRHELLLGVRVAM